MLGEINIYYEALYTCGRQMRDAGWINIDDIPVNCPECGAELGEYTTAVDTNNESDFKAAYEEAAKDDERYQTWLLNSGRDDTYDNWSYFVFRLPGSLG